MLGLILEPADDPAPVSLAERTVISNDIPLVIFAQPTHPLARTAPGSRRRDALGEYALYISDAAGDFHLLVRRYLERTACPARTSILNRKRRKREALRARPIRARSASSPSTRWRTRFAIAASSRCA